MVPMQTLHRECVAMSNPNDPLGLFPVSDPAQTSRYALASGAEQQPFQPQPPSQFTNIIVGVLIGIALVMGWQRFGNQLSPLPDDQRQEQHQSKVDAKTIVFIHERNPQSIDHSMLLRGMHDFAADRKLQFRALDDDLTDEPVPAVIAFAKSKGIDPPLMVLTDSSDKPIKAAKFPATLDEVAKFVGK